MPFSFIPQPVQPVSVRFHKISFICTHTHTHTHTHIYIYIYIYIYMYMNTINRLIPWYGMVTSMLLQTCLFLPFLWNELDFFHIQVFPCV